MDGENLRQSTKSLYIECRKQVNFGGDPILFEYLMAPGTVRMSGKKYPGNGLNIYVKLDPKGLGGGCTGTGELWD